MKMEANSVYSALPQQAILRKPLQFTMLMIYTHLERLQQITKPNDS